MRQHRFVLYSGLLGATASCIAKIVFSTAIKESSESTITAPEVTLDDDIAAGGGFNYEDYIGIFAETTPAQYLYASCQNHLANTPNHDDLDSVLLSGVYYVIGELLVRFRIVVLPYWKFMMRGFQWTALTLNLFEIDWCHATLLVPRIIGFVFVLVTNGLMVAYFLKGIQASGSVAGPALSSAMNFISSAAYGYMLWGEAFNEKWWLGFTSVLIGVMILSTVPATRSTGNAPTQTTGTATTTKKYGSTRKYGSAYVAKPPPPSQAPPPAMPSHVSTITNRINNAVAANKMDRSPIASSMITPTTGSSSTSGGFFSSSKSSSAAASSNSKKKKIKKNTIIPKPTGLVDVTFVNIRALCEDPLFEEDTGKALESVADLSPACYHIFHASCLKQQQSSASSDSPTAGGSNRSLGGASGGRRRSSLNAAKVGCPVCDKMFNMWISAKQSAHFAGFWMDRVEKLLLQMGPVQDPKKGPQPVPASVIRDHLRENDHTLTDEQIQYVDDDPSGLDKGLQGALEWGGYIDFNEAAVRKGNIGWSAYKRSCGIWSYSVKYDDIWLWAWDAIHPRQRCEACQFLKRPLPIVCSGCIGSSECAYYCSTTCQKRDWQRHKLMCETWQKCVPVEAREQGTKR